MAFQPVTSSVTDNFDKETKRKGYRFGDSPFLFLVCKANISSHKVTYLVGDDVHENPKATKERLVDPYPDDPL